MIRIGDSKQQGGAAEHVPELTCGTRNTRSPSSRTAQEYANVYDLRGQTMQKGRLSPARHSRSSWNLQVASKDTDVVELGAITGTVQSA